MAEAQQAEVVLAADRINRLFSNTLAPIVAARHLATVHDDDQRPARDDLAVLDLEIDGHDSFERCADPAAGAERFRTARHNQAVAHISHIGGEGFVLFVGKPVCTDVGEDHGRELHQAEQIEALGILDVDSLHVDLLFSKRPYEFRIVRDVPSQEQYLLLASDESESSGFVVFNDGVGRVIVRSKCQLEAMRDAAMNG